MEKNRQEGECLSSFSEQQREVTPVVFSPMCRCSAPCLQPCVGRDAAGTDGPWAPGPCEGRQKLLQGVKSRQRPGGNTP